MRGSTLSWLFLSFALLGGPTRAQDAPVPAHLSDAALPSPLDRLLRDYEHAWRAGDAAALAALFAEDGFVLQNHRPPVRGQQAIRAAYEAGFKGKGGGPFQLRALAYSTDATTGYIIGAYRYGAGGEVGKFTLTLQRMPGQPWKIFSDMDSLNAAEKRADAE